MLLPQERIPWILRFSAFRRDVLFRVEDGKFMEGGHSDRRAAGAVRPPGAKPAVYLTFDDGPIPESTPWLLETLAEFGAKATFFMVADNARRYPDLFRRVMAEGHAVGNHTFHHRPPFRQTVAEMLADVRLAEETFSSLKTQDLRLKTQDLRLFRPPHGLILPHQQKALSEAGYRIVMFDLNTLDYRADRTPEQILASVKANVRPGCIINLHDSLKSIAKLRQCLPHILAHLHAQGYRMLPLSMEFPRTPDDSVCLGVRASGSAH